MNERERERPFWKWAKRIWTFLIKITIPEVVCQRCGKMNWAYGLFRGKALENTKHIHFHRKTDNSIPVSAYFSFIRCSCVFVCVCAFLSRKLDGRTFQHFSKQSNNPHFIACLIYAPINARFYLILPILCVAMCVCMYQYSDVIMQINFWLLK